MHTKNTAYSILDLAIVSKGHSLQDTFKHSLELAQAAEEAGYTRYWLAEHHNSDGIGSSATSILIGKIAEGTKHIRVGSGGIMLPNHSPLIIAEQFGTLGILYPNRIDLGLGRAPGTDKETALAIRPDFYQATLAFPGNVQQIQNYFSLDNINERVCATVAEGVDVPIYILGSSTDSAHLAAKKGLPYAFASHFATPQLMAVLDIYRREFQPSEVLDKPYTMAGINIIVADTNEEAEQISTSLYRRVISLLTGKRDFIQPPTAMTEELRAMQQHPSVQHMLKYTFVGNKETVKQQVQAFIEETQIDELIVATHVYDGNDRIKSYQLFAEIMQELNNVS
ncbi:LLM class flavin-dependent oxidoreductase [Flavobacteriaceae bacterium XHP0103]|uniref:LLM class flavin-dependent oxidoreductase n=1 Tax=Marixanthotalea marina TaxID=2844359 RepID=UPI002989EC16|nr:LLM class flavin-dependent oxidoreductase [Marixanthotalea marina]MBU3821937.1 LLM class flavin-dependent oxidoreductase [Marixanthotalea marina]